jgi:hypothetical protein
VGEVIFDLTPHAIDLLSQPGREFCMTLALGAIGFLREHREGRLQSMCEVSSFRERFAHTTVLVREQHIEIVDERLHFVRIPAFDLPFVSVVHGGEAVPQVRQRLEPADREPQPAHHQHDGR